VKIKLVTRKPDEPWTLAQSWTTASASHAYAMARRAIDDGYLVTAYCDGVPVPIEELR
jgi:hypothetical protein